MPCVDHERVDHRCGVGERVDPVPSGFAGEQREVERRVVGDDRHTLPEQGPQGSSHFGDHLRDGPPVGSRVRRRDPVHRGCAVGDRHTGVRKPRTGRDLSAVGVEDTDVGGHHAVRLDVDSGRLQIEHPDTGEPGRKRGTGWHGFTLWSAADIQEKAHGDS